MVLWMLFEPKWWEKHRRARKAAAKLKEGAWLVVRFPDGTLELGKHRPRAEIETIRAGFAKSGVHVGIIEFNSRKAAKDYIAARKGERRE